jgi:hypothetical protein
MTSSHDDHPIEEGTWEYLQREGLWHFDPARSQTDFRVIGRIASGLDRLISERSGTASPKRLASSMVHRSPTDYFSRIQIGNKADARRYGYPPDLCYSHVIDRKGETTLEPYTAQLLQCLRLDDAYVKYHFQHPGNVWPMHFDNYHALRPDADACSAWNDPGVRRLLIALEDWYFGQVITFGTSVWTGWRAGDIAYFDWLVPHGSANIGNRIRSSMVITGRTNAVFNAWVASGTSRELDLLEGAYP